jgi:hypothetical protein
VGVAQDPESRPRHSAQLVRAVDTHQVVAAVAEEREVVVGEPFEEGAPFGQLPRFDRWRPACDFGQHLSDLATHRRPVRDRDAHVGERTRDLVREGMHAGDVAHAVDLDVHERLAPGAAELASRGKPEETSARVAVHCENGMDDVVQRESASVNRHGYRIDEERHVVVDDLDDRVGALPAVLLDGGIEDPYARVAGRASRRELPVRNRRAIEVLGRALGQLVGVDLPIMLLDEALNVLALRAGYPGPHERKDLGDALGHLAQAVAVHGSSPAIPRRSRGQCGRNTGS